VDPSGGRHLLRRHGRGVFTRELANGWSETAQYSPRGWCLAKLTYATDKPDAAWVRRYEYTGEGDLARVLDTERGVTQHTHDAAHRLVGTVHPDGNQDEYRYTKSGSLLKKPGLDEATVGHINQLRYADRHKFEYGRRQHVEKQRTPNGHELEYRYDARDQLVQILWNGQSYWSAEYDAIGRRIEKTVQGRRTRYWWDGDRLAAEELPGGGVRVYVYPDAFAMVPMLFVDYDSLEADPETGRRYYLFCDQRGCPERVVDDAGETVWEAYVEPYGTAHVRVGRDFHQPIRFPGHWWDAEIELHYNRFRYYSPWLGRYLQVDRLGEGGGLNVYAYTSGPLSRVDVRGLDDCGPEGGTDNTNADEAGDAPDSQRRPDPEGTVRDANGRLRYEAGHERAGQFAEDPNATGDYRPDVRTGPGRRLDTGDAALDPASPETAAALRERQTGLAERDRLAGQGEQSAANRAQAQANRATEELGEQATDAAVREVFPDADVEGAHRARGPGTFDRVYENGSPPPRYIIAEGKGGSATNSSSRQGSDGQRYQQGTEGYRRSVAENMAENGSTPEQRELGEALLEADESDIAYIEVSQPIDRGGNLGPIRAREYEDAE